MSSLPHGDNPPPEPEPPPPPEFMLTPADWQRLSSALPLSPRELETVQHIFRGHSEHGVAWQLGITANTVHTHIRRIYAKLKVTDRRELILRVIAEHLRGLSPEEGT